jgi:hypothetical protein
MYSFLRILFHNRPIHFRKTPKLGIYLFLKLALSPLELLENIWHGSKIRKHKIVKSPIFIIGHWRSGTTFLHQILSKDPGKSFLNFYQAVYPGCFILTEPLLKPFLQKLAFFLKLEIPYFNKIPFDWNFPCEEDTALLNLNSESSAYWAYLYPKSAIRWFSKTIFFKFHTDEEKWKKHYFALIKKISYYNDGKQLILKSPPNTGRIKQILQLFPEAKFIYLQRDPEEVFHSHQKLWQTNNKYFALQFISDREIKNTILETYKNLTYSFHTHKHLIQKENIYELHYDSLKNNTKEEIENLYKHLKLDNYINAKSYLNNFISGLKYQTFRYDIIIP